MYDTSYGHKTLQPGKPVVQEFFVNYWKATPAYLFITAIRSLLAARNT